MSILHFCRHEVLTDRWLDGAGGNERSLVGAAPQDQAVLDYAASPRFRQLLGVSDAWWGLADAVVRYEDLVADPEETLRRLAGELGFTVDVDSGVPAAVQSRRLEAMRVTSGNHHYWQGTPNGWRRLLPGNIARHLTAPVADLLSAGGYVVDPLPDLDASQAARNWAAVEARRATPTQAIPTHAIPTHAIPTPVRSPGMNAVKRLASIAAVLAGGR
jgi:hypothetical protein